MIRRPPRSTRTDTLVPYTTLFRSVTKDPSDYLEAGKDAYFGLRLGYEGSWDGLNAGATAAFGGGRWSGIAVVNHRQGQAPENRGKVDRKSTRLNSSH